MDENLSAGTRQSDIIIQFESRVYNLGLGLDRNGNEKIYSLIFRL